MGKTNAFVLYSTSACHLCDQAEAIISSAFLDGSSHFKKVDITDSESLYERYGWHIPVLWSVATEQELFWPFDELAVKQFAGCLD